MTTVPTRSFSFLNLLSLCFRDTALSTFPSTSLIETRLSFMPGPPTRFCCLSFLDFFFLSLTVCLFFSLEFHLIHSLLWRLAAPRGQGLGLPYNSCIYSYHLLIHLFKNIYYVTDTVLLTGDTAANNKKNS